MTSSGISKQSLALSCVKPYSFISKDEYEAYWHTLRDAAQAVEEDKVNPYKIVGANKGEIELNSFLAVATSPTYDLVAHFGKSNWPEDYVVRVGRYSAEEGCGVSDDIGFSMQAIPREPFVLFAVVTRTGSPVKIEALEVTSDNQEGLRDKASYTDMETIKDLGEPIVGDGRSLVIPLQIELRYDNETSPFRFISGESLIAADVRDLIRREVPVFDVPVKGSTGKFNRRTDKLPTPAYSDIRRKYIYGRAIALKSIRLKSEEVSVRKIPAIAAYLNWHYEMGSCPFLYFLNEHGDVLDRRRVLIGADEKRRERLERISVPEGAVSVVIEEAEPEVTFITEIQVRGSGSVESMKSIAIRPGEALGVHLALGSKEIVIRGFYNTLDRLTSNAGVVR